MKQYGRVVTVARGGIQLSNNQVFLSAAVGAILFASGGAAFAQTAGAGKAQPSEGATVDVVVVTASRREERLQDAPAAINVVAGATMEKLNVTNVVSLTNLVPGLKIDGNQRDQLRLGLRGAFSSSTTPGAAQSVGFYIDGVSYPHTSNLGANLFGVQRVEVLRGPQGTLYGQNVVGGLVNIITKDPGRDLEAEAKLSYSSFNRIDVGAYVAGPLSETLSGSIAFNTSHSDGWQRNLTTGNMLEQLDTWDARLKLVWRPTDELTVKLIQELASDTSYGISRNIVFGTPNRFSVPSSWKETRLQADGRYDSYSANTALLADDDLGWGVLSSISAYQHNRPRVIDAAQVTDPEAYQNLDRRNNNDTFTQEVRLSGVTGKLRWQGGFYFLNDRVTQYFRYDSKAVPGTRAFSGGLTTPNVLFQDFKVKARSYSVFAEGSYDLNEIISITAGGRFNWDKKDANFHNHGQPSAATGLGALTQAPFRVIQSEDWSEFTPKVTVNAKWDEVGPLDSMLVYGTVSKGYLSGSFSSGPTVAAATGAVPPQTAWNYEGGFKSTFWDRRATFNTTIFKVDYTNLQTLSLSSGGVQGVASTDAKAWGVESSLTLNPLTGLFLTADYSYLETKIAAGAKAPDGSNVGGNKLPQSPPWSYNFSASYVRPLVGETDIRFTAAYTDKGPVYYDVRNIRTSPFPSVMERSKLKNLDAEVALLHGDWELSLWGKNLTNRKNLLRAFDGTRNFNLAAAEVASGKTALDGAYATPRSVGVTLRWRH